MINCKSGCSPCMSLQPAAGTDCPLIPSHKHFIVNIVLYTPQWPSAALDSH